MKLNPPVNIVPKSRQAENLVAKEVRKAASRGT